MKMNLRLLLLSLLTVGLVAACGDDPEDTKGGNNDTTPDTGIDVGHDVSNDVDDDDTNVPDEDTTPPYVPDVDVFAEEPNDDLDRAVPFTPGQSIGGVIAAGSGEDVDVDTFSVQLTAGTVFSINFTEIGAGLTPLALFYDEDDNVFRLLDANVGTGREFFVPATDTYYITIQDSRASGGDAHGGPTAYYALETAVRTPDATPAELPSQVEGNSNSGSVSVYAVTPAEDQILVAETFAMRAPVGSELDTILLGWDVEHGTLLAENDDIDVQGGNYDSRVIFGVEKDKTYWVIVDSYVNAADEDFVLDLYDTDDDITAPRDLAPGDSVSSSILEPRGDNFDTDYFLITLEPGQIVRIELTADDVLEPMLDVFSGSGSGVGTALPVDGIAAIEFAHPADADQNGSYYVLVDDARNIPLDGEAEPANLGGAGYEYTITAELTQWTATAASFPINADADLGPVGSYAWYETQATENFLLFLDATGSPEAFSPMFGLLLDGSTPSLTDEPLTLIIQEAGPLVVGLRDEYFRGGDGYVYLPNFRGFDLDAPEYVQVDDTAGTDAATSQEVALPVAVSGVLDGVDTDTLNASYFKVALTAGQSLIAFTHGDPDADTVIRLLDTDGTTILIENDDQVSAEQSLNSAFLYDIEADGDYYVVVEPFCSAAPCAGNGDYKLFLFTDDPPQL